MSKHKNKPIASIEEVKKFIDLFFATSEET